MQPGNYLKEAKCFWPVFPIGTLLRSNSFFMEKAKFAAAKANLSRLCLSSQRGSLVPKRS
jgi:hypothetical protein